MILIGIILFFTLLEAIHEGLALQGKGTIAGVVEFVKLVGLTALVAFLPWIVMNNADLNDYYINHHKWHFWRYLLPHLVIGWLCIRYSVFDFIHNVCAKLDLYHVGTVKFYDRIIFWIMRKKLKEVPARFFWITRTLLLILGVTLILRI